MIVCLIEFGVREGQLQTRDELVAELMKAVVHIDGFVSKETFTSRDKPDKLVTLSYWRDNESLDRWMNETVHKRAIALGRRQVLSYFKTQILSVDRNVEWAAPGTSA
jgi:heme-degrading monooxygenase HmoA